MIPKSENRGYPCDQKCDQVTLPNIKSSSSGSFDRWLLLLPPSCHTYETIRGKKSVVVSNMTVILLVTAVQSQDQADICH